MVFQIYFRHYVLVVIITFNIYIVTNPYRIEEKELNKTITNILEKFNKRNDNYVSKNNGSIVYSDVTSLSVSKQFDMDILILYKTLFPETKIFEDFINKKSDFIKMVSKFNLEIINSFKKIIFSLFDLGLYYSYEENKILKGNDTNKDSLWPHPLASSLCHGGRITYLINESNLISGHEAMEYLFKKNYSLLYKRETSSHKIEVEKSSYIIEKKIIVEAAWDWMKTLFYFESSPHMGMNVPVGGIGNYWPNEKFTIFNQGYGDKGDYVKTDPDPLQHGHLFVRYDELREFNYSTILLGLEEEAPRFKGMFAKKPHDLFNAFYTPTTSACGGSKWKELGSKLNYKIPNNYGGKAVFFNRTPNEELFKKIENFEDINLKKKTWWIILSLNSFEQIEFKEKFLSLSENAFKIKLFSLE